MKRLTDTEIWRAPWFLALKPKHKLLWRWLVDRCDNAGMIEVHWGLASLEVGFPLEEADMEALNGRVQKVRADKWHIPKFVAFQFGELHEGSRVHQAVSRLIEAHKRSDSGYPMDTHSIPYGIPCHTPKDKDKDEDKDSGEGAGGVNGEPKPTPANQRPKREECSAYAATLGMPADQGEAFFDHFSSNGWKVGGKTPMRDWQAALRNWKRNWEARSASASPRFAPTIAPGASAPALTPWNAEKVKDACKAEIEKLRADGKSYEWDGGIKGPMKQEVRQQILKLRGRIDAASKAIAGVTP